MSIVLPGVADAAEHLDRGIADGGQPSGERLRPQRGQVPLRRLLGVASAAHSAWITPLRASSTVSYMSTHKCWTA